MTCLQYSCGYECEACREIYPIISFCLSGDGWCWLVGWLLAEVCNRVFKMSRVYPLGTCDFGLRVVPEES